VLPENDLNVREMPINPEEAQNEYSPVCRKSNQKNGGLKSTVRAVREGNSFVPAQWLRGPATPRKRHPLILPYRFGLIRDVAA
jgi:hypothetical protein